MAERSGNLLISKGSRERAATPSMWVGSSCQGRNRNYIIESIRMLNRLRLIRQSDAQSNNQMLVSLLDSDE